MATSEDLPGHHFLRLLAFLTVSIRKLFIMADKSFLCVHRSPHIIWLKPKPNVSTLKKKYIYG